MAELREVGSVGETPLELVPLGAPDAPDVLEPAAPLPDDEASLADDPEVPPVALRELGSVAEPVVPLAEVPLPEVPLPDALVPLPAVPLGDVLPDMPAEPLAPVEPLVLEPALPDALVSDEPDVPGDVLPAVDEVVLPGVVAPDCSLRSQPANKTLITPAINNIFEVFFIEVIVIPFSLIKLSTLDRDIRGKFQKCPQSRMQGKTQIPCQMFFAFLPTQTLSRKK